MEDIQELKPTVFCGVPRVYDRIYAGIQHKISTGGGFGKMLFQYAYDTKLKKLKRGLKQDRASPFFDRLVFSKIKQGLRGRVRIMLSRAAPLPRHVEEFLRVTRYSQNSNVKTVRSSKNTIAKYPLLRRRRRLFVIAIDAYNNEGGPDKTMVQVVNEVFRSIKSDSQMSRISGFGLSIAMPISETLQLLKSGKIQVKDFDVLICSSGSEVSYPGTYQCEDEGNFCPDPDYAAYIDYPWGHDGVKTTIEKLMNSQGDDKKPSRVVVEDLKSSNTHCVSFLIKDPSKAMQVDDLRQKLRMHGLRCHVMYCRTSTRLQVVPLLASRSQALSSHWMLVVADPYAQSIYFFDPLGHDPREDLRLLIPMAFKLWLAQKGIKWKNLTWNLS